MTAAIRKQIERSRHKHAGSKRVEVVLDVRSLACLETIRAETNAKSIAEAVAYALQTTACQYHGDC